MNSLYHPVGLPKSSQRLRIARAMSFSALQNAADARACWTDRNKVAIPGLQRAALIRAHAIFLQASRDWHHLGCKGQPTAPIKLPG